MKTSLFLIAVVSAQIASAQYYADGSPRTNRQLRGLEEHATKSSTKSSEPKAEVVKESKGASEKAASEKGASEKGAKSEKV